MLFAFKTVTRLLSGGISVPCSFVTDLSPSVVVGKHAA